LHSKKGIVGVLVAAYAIYDIIHKALDFLRDVAFAAKHAGPVVDFLSAALTFLATGWGNLVAIVVGVILILWALRTPQPVSSSTPESSDATPEATSSEELQAELEQLRRNLAEVEQERDSREAIIEGQQEQLSEWEGDRRRFKEFLTEAWVEGTNLGGSKPSKEEAWEWEGHVRYLIEQAVGKEVADRVLKHDPQFQSADFDASDAQKFLEMRLHRLDDLRKSVSKHGAIPFRFGFDPYEWDDWKSPPRSESEVGELKAENEQLMEELHQTKRERDELKADERRRCIEHWRSVIHDFDFHAENFADTDTYSQMKLDLRPEVIEMFEAQRTIHVGNEARGDTAYKYTLLDEIARIERKWGLL
jgi:hypothetical protein